ncbi:hypothetical protein K7432_017889 [Basidiobolus ranarum]|uniref:protein S-acyltransferase n=1 Tax=Basidiobolus ranarum TaxID=34480 RepID=A0ABR2WCU4_9FUNG
MNKLSKPVFKPNKPKTKPFLNLGLHSGAASGNLGLVKFALDHGQSINSVVNGVLPIHAACCSGNPAVVKYLIDRGADVNARRFSRRYSGESADCGVGSNATGNGSTPLHYACANGCMRTVVLLLSYGAFPDIPDKYGSTPLSMGQGLKHHPPMNI